MIFFNSSPCFVYFDVLFDLYIRFFLSLFFIVFYFIILVCFFRMHPAEEVVAAKGSVEESQVRALCAALGIDYDNCPRSSLSL